MHRTSAMQEQASPSTPSSSQRQTQLKLAPQGSGAQHVLIETVDGHVMRLPPVVACGSVMICSMRLTCSDASIPLPLVTPRPPTPFHPLKFLALI